MTRKLKSEADLLVTAAGAAPARRKPVTATRKKPRVVAADPTPEAVAQLAYSYWEARGFHAGSPEEDWLRAERQVMHPKATAQPSL